LEHALGSREKSWRIRTRWRPGYFGRIVLAHGEFIAGECGFDHTFEQYVAGGLLEFCEDPNPGNRFWLVVQQEEVRGSIFLHVRSDCRAQIRWFWLHPDLRGFGLGRELLERLIDQAHTQSLSSIYLWTVAGLEASAHLYGRVGFCLTESESKHQWGREITEQKLELKLVRGAQK
jgi:N-acetylglutamate synthase-like GNAT family acetyltransferase